MESGKKFTQHEKKGEQDSDRTESGGIKNDIQHAGISSDSPKESLQSEPIFVEVVVRPMTANEFFFGLNLRPNDIVGGGD